MKKVQCPVFQDRRVIITQIIKDAGMLIHVIHNIPTAELNVKKLSVRLVPVMLTSAHE